MNLSKVTQKDILLKLTESLELVKNIPTKIANLSTKTLMTPVAGLNQE